MNQESFSPFTLPLNMHLSFTIIIHTPNFEDRPLLIRGVLPSLRLIAKDLIPSDCSNMRVIPLDSIDTKHVNLKCKYDWVLPR